VFTVFFSIPYILLAPLAGFLNDRDSKTRWLLGGNLIKLIGTTIGLAGVLANHGEGTAARLWQLIGYCVVGIGACVYSPAKYGVLPEIVPAERLVKANGSVEMLTLVAILGGLFGGAWLFDHFRSLTPCYLAALLQYSLALGFNWAMTRTPNNPSAQFRSSMTEFWQSLRSLITHPRLGRVLVGCAAFWFAGATLKSNLQGWGIDVLTAAGVKEITNVQIKLLNVGLILGIVSGSVIVGQLHGVGDLSWSRRYGWCLSFAVLLLGLAAGKFGLIVAVTLLVFAGGFAGLLIVPLNAALQHEGEHSRLGKIVAIQNFVDYLAMFLGAGFVLGLSAINLNAAQIFVGLALVLGATSLALAFGRRPTAKVASVATTAP
jgi:LPLT family lysophospholipid transporter-like MFS transporter